MRCVVESSRVLAEADLLLRSLHLPQIKGAISDAGHQVGRAAYADGLTPRRKVKR